MTPSEEIHDRREEQSNCCPEDTSRNCCSTPGETSRNAQIPRVRSWGRTAILTVIVSAAVLLSARAFMKGSATDGTDARPGASVTSGGVVNSGLANATPPSPDASSASCCPTVSSAAEATEYAAGSDAVFLILSGDGSREIHSVTDQVEAVVNALTTRGKLVRALTLDQDAPGYDELAQKAAAQSYPCVIALAPSGQLSSAGSEITEDGLLRAFVEATIPSASCDTPCGVTEACGN